MTILNKNIALSISIVFAILFTMGAIGVTLSADSGNVGTRITLSWTGLTAENSYQLKDASGNILEAFTTAVAETTHESSVILAKSGSNKFYLHNVTTTDTLEYTVEVIGIDPFDELIFTLAPLILAIAVVYAFFKLMDRF